MRHDEDQRMQRSDNGSRRSTGDTIWQRFSAHAGTQTPTCRARLPLSHLHEGVSQRSPAGRGHIFSGAHEL
jgi:hypothetical protein